MPGRQYYAANGYRYGFNGKENDNEVKGEGNSLDFGNRIYDSRLGRWSSPDHILKAWLSSYQFASDNPINIIDPDGGDEIHFYYFTVYRQMTLSQWDNGRGGFVTVTRPMAQTYRWTEVIKDNNKDRFFVHRQNVAKSETIEFYPNSGDRSKSGATYTSYFFNLFKIKDEDYVSLQKFADDFPELESKVIGAEYTTSNSGWSQHKETRAFWQSFYSNLKATREIEKEQAQVDHLMLGIIAGAATELFIARVLTSVATAGGYGSMTNLEVRLWYNRQLTSINTNVAFTEENAGIISAQRNLVKTEARLLMKDRTAAATLEKTDPIRSFDYYVEKYKAQGYKGDALWKKIIESGKTPNAEINKQFGIK